MTDDERRHELECLRVDLAVITMARTPKERQRILPYALSRVDKLLRALPSIQDVSGCLPEPASEEFTLAEYMSHLRDEAPDE